MKRVLVVDDSATETHQLVNILSKHGYEVVLADTGEAGVELADRESPDLVLMDIVMPGINGFQATRQLHRNPRTSDIPVIIVTTKNQESDREWSRRQGARGYLVKPVPERELINTIETVLAVN
ncbi:MAG: response regulator [Gammaproteobacteria bacterium]|nr:response regulator [Gammaproteobacteria bacterium]MBT8150508.1 response regulator [Gammaproteobacteria bacterium]NND38279.1 response regulator [Pseudomonadales bacterium]NNL10731.1 response regulator [Pseudomonadales bacterium]RZV55093.1 MAG: response regulator [Pseudomonadales bacterium]